jgi:hypothetical protein
LFSFSYAGQIEKSRTVAIKIFFRTRCRDEGTPRVSCATPGTAGWASLENGNFQSVKFAGSIPLALAREAPDYQAFSGLIAHAG